MKVSESFSSSEFEEHIDGVMKSKYFEIEVDEAVKATQDPTGGRGLNGHITERLENSQNNEEEVLQAAV